MDLHKLGKNSINSVHFPMPFLDLRDSKDVAEVILKLLAALIVHFLGLRVAVSLDASVFVERRVYLHIA